MNSHIPIDRIAGYSALATLAFILLIPAPSQAESDNSFICNEESRYSKRQLNSDQVDNLCEAHQGKVMLVVNTASRCAFTDQYEGLEKLYSRYRERGLVVIGFPSNDFGNQEPGSEGSIKKFCRLTYGVQFPMYAKSRVTGDNADPFYRALAKAAGTPPRWNFHKYLIDRDGRLAGSYKSSIAPENEKLIKAIEGLL
ncbi:MAG: glutathione peroxidase [gamma proteobacterium symbiont of Ctena orbiculata]|nr:MAG: glutathione peroxidase [gamma proteobacterium symbiont of Ctena orbiculata]PVV16955.1 MAG: glutathione peroxidase [gamma proteobacterium symbiont of Ctena orbiculata]PVV23788.1 MAG: glutathione peroxidase [gamma proteobacterium symbiont of Ctena orbiculata]